MAKSKRIKPDFMIDNPDDSFMFMMPLDLKPNLEEDIGNSYFNVVVKNLTKKEHFATLMAPEVFFTRFKLQKAYKNGSLDKYFNKKNDISTETYRIDTRLTPKEYDIALELILPKKEIGQLLGWTYAFIDKANEVRCCLINVGGMDLIIPHYVLGIYYYYRSTTMREATLRCNLEDLHYGYDCTPDNASIIVPKYVSRDDTPFIHRFLCQSDAASAFKSMGTYLNAYIKREKDKNLNEKIDSIPIKAKFPQQNEFFITIRVRTFELEGKKYQYVHEIIDDDSPIGFSKFTIFFQGKKIVTAEDDLDNMPTVPVENPSETSERLKTEHGNRKYKRNSITTKNNKCSSLANIEITTDKITDEEALERLKILEEKLSNENVDQSLTDSSGNKTGKTRKARISSKGTEFLETSQKEYVHNFDEFKLYIDYMETQKMIENLQVHTNQKMKTVMNGKNGNANPKCKILGRERQYITATFKYEETYVGLLELENRASNSTWVISSKSALGDDIFDKFLKHYVDENKSIKKLKDMYKGTSGIKFKTKNHEKLEGLDTGDTARWAVGVLSKIVKT